jgi:hypothetical protein
VIVGLRFYNNSESIELIAETDAEKALLGFVAEDQQRRWKVSSGFNYRPAGVERVVLERVGQLESERR